MFKEITRTNDKGQEVVSLIKTEDIAYVHEEQKEYTRTYNEDGSVATETPKPRMFSLILVLKNEHHVVYKIDETQYENLKEQLTSTK